MDANIYSQKGKKSEEKVKLDKIVFGQDTNEKLLSQAIRVYSMNNRVGSASTKDRSEIRGGGRKPRKQKTPGETRMGSLNTPMYRGGGVAFGPHAKDFSLKMSKEMRKKSLYTALSLHAKEGSLVILDSIKIGDKKLTSTLSDIVIALKVKKPLIITDKPNRKLFLASRNLSNVSVKSVEHINTYDVLTASNIVILKDALEKF